MIPSSLAALLTGLFSSVAVLVSLYVLYTEKQAGNKVSLNIYASAIISFALAVFNFTEYVHPFQSNLSVTGTTAGSLVISGLALVLVSTSVKDDD